MTEIMEVTDENGNRCTVAIWGSVEAARAALATLRNCSRCSDCLGCARCSHCSRCTDCSRCSDCSRCARCSHCSGCTNCTDCMDCTLCTNCTEQCIVGPRRSDGYTFFLSKDGHIHAGCRDFATFADARAHWNKTRGGTKLGIETIGILSILEQLASLHT